VNLALLLTPLAKVASMAADLSVRDALARLDEAGFTAVPVLDRDGVYLGTLTEGDLLRWLRSGADLDAPVLDVPTRLENRPVPVVATVEAVVLAAADQNFVPVVDSRGVLMGIVTRRALLTALWKRGGA
jgi:CBS domain-containing protein